MDLHYNDGSSIFSEIIKKAFGQRRKMLKNSLQDLKSIQYISNKYRNKRPEELSVNDYIEIVTKEHEVCCQNTFLEQNLLYYIDFG